MVDLLRGSSFSSCHFIVPSDENMDYAHVMEREWAICKTFQGLKSNKSKVKMPLLLSPRDSESMSVMELGKFAGIVNDGFHFGQVKCQETRHPNYDVSTQIELKLKWEVEFRNSNRW